MEFVIKYILMDFLQNRKIEINLNANIQTNYNWEFLEH